MTRALGFLASGAFVVGCAAMAPAGPTAVATVQPTKGNTAAGTVTFVQRGDKVRVSAKLGGLSAGNHGFHVHEKGDCSADDGMSAGGHFNPGAKPHAHPSTANRHAGDMPMLSADAAGNATLEVELDVITVGSGANDVIGKSVVVHRDPDDFTTQPAGNAGARVACGVIRKA